MDSVKILKSYVDRAVRIKQEIEDRQADLSEIYKEASGNGIDKKALKEVIKRATMSSEEMNTAEQLDLLVETYWSNYINGTTEKAENQPSHARARTREYMGDEESSSIASMTITSEEGSVTITSQEAKEIIASIDSELSLQKNINENRLSKLREALA
jgi:uncharacterized protein (UPF0335 family)